MAGFFAHFGPTQPHRLAAAGERLRFADEHEVAVAEDGFSFLWSGHDDVQLFGPAHDPATGVRVVTAGRVSWDEPAWQRAEQLGQYEGGLSNRLLLDAYLRDGVGAVERHNGPALLMVWDPRVRRAHLFTDHLGYHPVFLYRPDDAEACVVCTHPDVLADDEAVEATLDPVAMAEFLRYWRVVPPNTYYREIKYAGAATHRMWDLTGGRVEEREYWDPFEQPFFPSANEAAEELADALAHAVRIRTLPRLSPTLCYISGGMDSRTILFGADDPEHTVGLNLYDVPNREAAVARQISVAAGARYEGFQRDADYYARWLDEGVHWSGAMWCAEDNHFIGTAAHVHAQGMRTVLTGCTADWMFKGYGMEASYMKLMGRNLPIKKRTNRRVDAFLPNHAREAPAQFDAAIRERFAEWFDGTPTELREERDWLRVEDRRARPACYTPSVSGPIMYRVFPYDTFLADRAVVDCYGRLRPDWKLNSVVWGKAVSRLSGAHGDIPISNFGWRLDAPLPLRLAIFAQGWLKRRFNPPPSVVGQGPATDGSWPKLGWVVAHSPTIKAMWEGAHPEDREALAEAWGSDPWQWPLEKWAGRPAGFFRLLTLLSYHRNRREASVTV